VLESAVFVTGADKFAATPALLSAFARYVREEAGFICGSLWLPAPSVEGQAYTPTLILLPCLPALPVEVKVSLL
jgi:hypothetical protein